jgi:hypothetical protein
MNFDLAEEQATEKEDSNEGQNISEDIRNGDFVQIPVSETFTEPKIITGAFDKPEVMEVTPLWARLAIVASVLLALFAGWSAVQMSEMNLQMSELKKDNEQMTAAVQSTKKNMEYAGALAELYRNPNFKLIRMAGLEKSPESSVAAFWNQKTNEVMLDVQKLPAAPAGKQYQLWSIVDGKPVDIGMLDDEFSGKVLKMRNTKAGSVAFAITLEKTGGVPSPTMEEMYVMGKV